MHTRRLALLVVTVAAFLVVPLPGRAQSISGPALTTPTALMDAAFHCGPGVATKKTVLLVHGTAMTSHEAWSWGYARALPKAGFAVCTVDLPDRSTVSLWKQSDYVVYAIRKAARLSGGKISVIGHSQGGAYPLWAIKFWPDVANKVDDYIGLAPGVHGTALGNLACLLGSCPDISWQVRFGSKATARLNDAPLPGSVSYTSIMTRQDEIVFPQPRASRIAGGANIFVQSICPLRVVDHVVILADSVGWALTLDALTHHGPADPARIKRSVCLHPFLPNIDLLGAVPRSPDVFLALINAAFTGPRSNAEPALPTYAR